MVNPVTVFLSGMIRLKITGCTDTATHMKNSWLVPASEIGNFSTIIDVRTPLEFAEDHVPGAINCPVLSNEQRAQVGTIYKQVSPFEAKKIGGALIAANIATHIQQGMLDMPKDWRPLIYCWRGGMRSGAMQIILRQIGWQAHKLEGGYKAFRQHVMEQTQLLAPRLSLHIICGATGSAKTRILQAIGARGGQILDLETLASHKGSVLGSLPGQPQPSQTGFETAVWQALEQLDPARPVFVEAESRKVGNLHIPEPLIERMRASPCLDIEATRAARVSFLLRDYDYACRNLPWLEQRLDKLRERQGRAVVDGWKALAAQSQWDTLVGELLDLHYDPLYRASQGGNYTGERPWPGFSTDDLSEAGIDALARQILERSAG